MLEGGLIDHSWQGDVGCGERRPFGLWLACEDATRRCTNDRDAGGEVKGRAPPAIKSKKCQDPPLSR